MSIRDELQQPCEKWIQEVADAVKPLDLEGVDVALRRDLDSALADPRIRVVVCGEWSTGKSTLVNALVGSSDLLPMDVAPCTSYITVVESSPTSRIEVVRDGTAAPLSRQEFLALTADKEGDATIETIRVTAPLSWPNDPAVLVDTPGLADITKTRSEVTLFFLPQADVILLVVDAVTGVKDSVLTFVREHLTAREQRRVIFAMNRKDTLNTVEDVARRLAACGRDMERDLPSAKWIATDARSGLKADGAGYQESGIPGLREVIEEMVRSDRNAILTRRFVNKARARLGDLDSRLVSEDSSLGLTLEEAEKRLHDFRQQLRDVSQRNDAAFRKARSIIEQDLEKWLQGVPARVMAVEGETLQHVDTLDDLDALRAFVNTDELGRALGQELRVISDEMADRLSAAIEKASKDVLAEQLAAPVLPQIDAAELQPPVETIFRHVPKVVVQILEVVLIDVMLPGWILPALLARLGLGAILQKVKGLGLLKSLLPTEVVKGQLRGAVAESLSGFTERVVPALRAAADEAGQNALDEIRAALESRVAAIEAGLEDAQVALAQDQSRVESRKALLATARSQLTRLGDDLDVLAH